ncbi:ubiquitin carboxyl-terminal hydrolase 20, partial [Phtheirospermum japonicum]
DFSSGFQRFQQEDAHEFLQCFLDRLETCHDSSQSDNIVKQVFGGCLVSKVEKIEDPETKFTCEKCKEQVSIEKQLSFNHAPSVAVFQLKRFKNDGCLVQKIDKDVAFPLDLDLLPFTAGILQMELKYVLYAIVVHVGLTSTSGHYYCFIRLSPNLWCKFDDSRVVLVDEDFVLSQEAYLLFYAKEGTSWFSSFIETQKFLSEDSNIWNTSPKSVLDRVDTSPGSCNLENKFKEIDNNNEIKDSRHMVDKLEINGTTDNLQTMSTLEAPPSASPLPKAHKEVSPTLVDKVKRSKETCVVANCQVDVPESKPLRSPSPEIYREDPPGKFLLSYY